MSPLTQLEQDGSLKAKWNCTPKFVIAQLLLCITILSYILVYLEVSLHVQIYPSIRRERLISQRFPITYAQT